MNTKVLRVIALVLAIGLLMAIGAGAFTDDAAIAPEYADAVAIVSSLEIVNGFEDGSFRPEETLTRAQAAKILCCTMAGGAVWNVVPAVSATFSDVPTDHWANVYVEYCARLQIISGVGGGKFNPNGKLTACALGKMLLVAFGYDAAAEGLTGVRWAENTRKILEEKGYAAGVPSDNTPISRQAACQMICNFMMHLRQQDTVNVRHLLVTPADAGSEAAWSEAKGKAEALYEQWKANGGTEAAFAVLASENSQDPGSASVGGLYENVYPGQMVQPFNDWCFDPARQTGDSGIVQTSYGYHLMYFCGLGEPIYYFQK